MDKIAREVEKDINYESILHFRDTHSAGTAADAISAAAASIAEALFLNVIICYTSTGTTALRVARQRPQQPILVLTPVTKTLRRLNLVWGLHCVHTADPANVGEMVKTASGAAKTHGYADDGEKAIVCAGVPFGKPGTTNMVRIFTVGENGTSAD